jgi:hypothetical protein
LLLHSTEQRQPHIGRIVQRQHRRRGLHGQPDRRRRESVLLLFDFKPSGRRAQLVLLMLQDRLREPDRQRSILPDHMQQCRTGNADRMQRWRVPGDPRREQPLRPEMPDDVRRTAPVPALLGLHKKRRGRLYLHVEQLAGQHCGVQLQRAPDRDVHSNVQHTDRHGQALLRRVRENDAVHRRVPT